jgi:Uma2 family endonuclease
MALPEKRSSISYAAFMELGEDVQYEVINGQIYNMSPSPSVKHQSIAAELLTEFNLFLRGRD